MSGPCDHHRPHQTSKSSGQKQSAGSSLCMNDDAANATATPTAAAARHAYGPIPVYPSIIAHACKACFKLGAFVLVVPHF